MEYSIIYSKRKTISISISDGNVIVKAPLKTPENVINDMIEKHEKWIRNNLENQKRKLDIYNSLTSKDISRLKKEAKIYFTDKIDYFSKIMGLKYSRMKITSASKRFGSCNSSGNICFSYRLMLFPERAREYVVVHELAHLIEMNHSKRFYSIVEAVLPDYKERKRLLK